MAGDTCALRRHAQHGRCFDNAAIESFFGTLKAEFFHLAKIDNVVQLEAGVHE